jgi:hypothetical protein
MSSEKRPHFLPITSALAKTPTIQNISTGFVSLTIDIRKNCADEERILHYPSSSRS